MAASPTKPSQIEAVESSNAPKDETKPDAISASLNEASMATVSKPTYLSSELSETYLGAKKCLADGDFEQALAKVEEGIMETQTVLQSLKDSGDDIDVDLHESLAPFHYLYGTTLLYSIEESTDSQQVTTDQTVAKAGDIDQSEAPPPVEEEENDGAEQEKENDSNEVGSVDNADDMQIAWENLEAARTILQNMREKGSSIVDNKKLESDLAQIFLREGDLGRMNGRYLEAIDDYNKSLTHRMNSFESEEEKKSDRRIADVQCNLGLVYLTSSSELQKQVTNPAEDDGNGGNLDPETRIKLSKEHRTKGILHYVDCAKSLCGRIALKCGADVDSIVNGNGKEQSAPGGKTTGMDEDAIKLSNASATLTAMRKRVTDLKPLEAEDMTVDELREFLDEIQENIDEAEKSQDAVRQVSEIKVKAQNAVAQLEQGSAVESADGAVTTIGFGNSELIADSPLVPAAAAAAASKPMMVVRKKKKREAESVPASSGGSAEKAPKRTKTD